MFLVAEAVVDRQFLTRVLFETYAKIYRHSFANINQILVSVPIFCDANCNVIFTKKDVKVIKNVKIIITGIRD